MIASTLIVEDIPETPVGLEKLVCEVFADGVVQKATSVREAIDMSTSVRFDLALIDLSLHRPDTINIAATVMGSDTAIVSALSAGAQGYVLKSDPDALLKQQLGNIHLGIPPLSPAVARNVMEHFRFTGTGAGPVIDSNGSLTVRESEILSHIAKGLRVSDTATALGIASGTVSRHLKTIYKKLDVILRAEATRMGLIR